MKKLFMFVMLFAFASPPALAACPAGKVATKLNGGQTVCVSAKLDQWKPSRAAVQKFAQGCEQWNPKYASISGIDFSKGYQQCLAGRAR